MLVLLLASGFSFLAAYATKWVPGSSGRFNSSTAHEQEESLLGHGPAARRTQEAGSWVASRPKKWYLPVVIMCIVLRLEASHAVNARQQCSTPGVEVCMVLLKSLPYPLC